MRSSAGLAATACAIALAACATPPVDDYQTISIPYDPYDFDPADLQAEADAHCSAYNLRAVYEDETVDTASVRWRYRHYRCI